MKVKVIKKFKDKRNNMKIRKVGEIIEVTEERYKELVTSPFGVLVEEIKEEKQEVEEINEVVEEIKVDVDDTKNKSKKKKK